MNSTDFTGQRPWPVLLFSFFACAVRPTPPQKRRKGMQRVRASTASRYFFASDRSLPATAAAVSRVFCAPAARRRTRQRVPPGSRSPQRGAPRRGGAGEHAANPSGRVLRRNARRDARVP